MARLAALVLAASLCGCLPVSATLGYSHDGKTVSVGTRDGVLHVEAGADGKATLGLDFALPSKEGFAK